MKLDFAQEVYELVRSIPKGKVSTYKEIARAVGKPKAVRAIGQVLKANKNLKEIPCYRVVCSDGMIGRYCGAEKKNIQKKIGMLKMMG